MPRWLGLLCVPVLTCGLVIVSTPSAHAGPEICPVNRYLAKYYDNLTHSGLPVMIRCETAVGGAWGRLAPGLDVLAGHFSAVYSGSIEFPATGTYNWNADTGDVGVRASIDGQTVIDQPQPSYGDYLVSGVVNQGRHIVEVTVINPRKDGEEDFSVSLSGTGTPSPNGNYFAADSFFNRVIPANPRVDPQSLMWLGLIYTDRRVNGIVFNYDAWTVPIYKAWLLAPRVSIALTNSNTHITIPYAENFKPSPDADAHLAVIDTTNGCDYEFQAFDPKSMSAHASATYHSDTGSGGHVSDQGHAGGEMSYIGGTITPQDVNAGVIRHALRFALPDNTWTFTYPGTRSDGTTHNGVPEGTLMQLDPNLDLSLYNLTPFQLMVAKALQTYGAYDGDSSGTFALYAESTTDGSTYSQQFATLPKSLILGLRFLAPEHSSTAIKLDARNDTSCQQPH